MNGPGTKMRWMMIIGALVIVILIVEVVVLVIQNRELKATLQAILEGARSEILTAGDRVGPVHLTALDNTTMQLDYAEPDGRYLLLIFSADCPVCDRNLGAWNSIAGSVSGAGRYVFGLSVDGIEKTGFFTATSGVRFYVASTAGDTDFRRVYKIAGVPETIAVRGGGIVEKVWQGELTKADVEEIQDFLRSKGAS